MRALPLAACLLAGCAGSTALPLVHYDDAEAHAARLEALQGEADSFTRYDSDGDRAVAADEWVEAEWDRALAADLDEDGALDRYEALLYRDVTRTRALKGADALAEFGVYWRTHQQGGKLRKDQLTADFRRDFAAADADRDGRLACREIFAAPEACPKG